MATSLVTPLPAFLGPSASSQLPARPSAQRRQAWLDRSVVQQDAQGGPAAPVAPALPSFPSRCFSRIRVAEQGWVASAAAFLVPLAAARKANQRRHKRHGARSLSSSKCQPPLALAATAFGEPGELFQVPPLTEDREALIVWLHGLGDTGMGWSNTAPALQQMGLPFLRLLFPTAPIRDAGGKGPCPSWFEVSTLDADAIAQMSTSPVGL